MKNNKSWLNPKSHYLEVISNPWYKLIFKIENEISILTTEFYRNKKIPTAFLPITTGSISSPMGLGSDSIPVKVNICGIDTYLADSMQFMLEYACRIDTNGAYYIMPSFRGEKADERHLCQFYHSEAEIPGTLDDIIKLVEEYIKFLSKGILNALGEDISLFTSDVKHIENLLNKNEFPRIRYDDAINLLEKERINESDNYCEYHNGYRVITRQGEKKLIDLFGGIVWLTHFDYMAVPFYQAYEKDTGKVLNADLLFGIGEVVGSGERHFNSTDVLGALKEHQVNPNEYEWYLKLKELYPMKTSGFGMGIERYILWLLKHDDIRDCQILPRFNGEEIYM